MRCSAEPEQHGSAPSRSTEKLGSKTTACCRALLQKAAAAKGQQRAAVRCYRAPQLPGFISTPPCASAERQAARAQKAVGRQTTCSARPQRARRRGLLAEALFLAHHKGGLWARPGASAQPPTTRGPGGGKLSSTAARRSPRSCPAHQTQPHQPQTPKPQLKPSHLKCPPP
jgi:hypothetical protein